MSGHLRVLSLFLISILFISCNQNNSTSTLEEPESLSGAHDRWEAADLHDYAVEVKQTCFCIVPRHYRLVVRDDTVSQITNLGTDEELSISLDHYNTIDDWFAWLRHVAQGDPEIMELEFDAHRGFPTTVNYDKSYQIADEEIAAGVQ